MIKGGFNVHTSKTIHEAVPLSFSFQDYSTGCFYCQFAQFQKIFLYKLLSLVNITPKGKKERSQTKSLHFA